MGFMLLRPTSYSVQAILQIYKIGATFNNFVKFNIVGKENTNSIVVKYFGKAINKLNVIKICRS